MGRYWALWVLSLIFRGLGIIAFVLTFIFSCLTIAVPVVGILWFVYGVISSLTIYGFGQFILLLLSLQDSSYRTASIMSIRAPKVPKPSIDPSSDVDWQTEAPEPAPIGYTRRFRPPAPEVPPDDPRRPRTYRKDEVSSNIPDSRLPRPKSKG